MGSFSDKLQQATNEDKQVNPIYVNEIKKGISRVSGGMTRIDTEVIMYPQIKTDGIFKCYYINDDGMELNFLLQLECKLDVDFSDPKERAKVLLQVCCYLKQIHDDVVGYGGTWETNALPKVVVLGSKVNCVTLPTKALMNYANNRIAGFKSASTAHTNPENQWIVEQIAEDGNIHTQAIVYNTSDKDCISRICEEIVKLGQGLKITDDLNEHTVSLAFDFFDMYVLDQKSSEKLSSREKVDLFIGTFFNEEFEETKTNRFASSPDKLRIHGIEVKINADKYNQFKLLYNMREYSRLEQKQITAITDRLIEDTDRRRKGDFYTPSIWVDEAHKLLDKNLGSNWREEYMVWDCAWGTGNLTRDYQFADLYCSTIQEEDLNIGYRYNKNAVKFQYDFLNDDVDEMEQIQGCMMQAHKIKESNREVAQAFVNQANAILFNTKLYKQASGLIDGLLGINGKEKKKLLFLINPPYAGVGSMGNKSSKENKTGAVDSLMADKMKEDGITGTGQLYAQFVYRVQCIKTMFNADVSLALYSPSQVLNAVTLDKIRKNMIGSLSYTSGIMFQASQFANVSGEWAISFTLWSGENNKTLVDVLSNDDGEVKIIGQDKYIKMLEKDEKALNWIRLNNKYPTTKVPRFTSAINYDSSREYDQSVGAIGTVVMDMGIVESNFVRCAIMQSRTNANWSIIDIMPENYEKVISLFTARKIIEPNWINSKDEYRVPNITDSRYQQWINDCVVFSIFNNALNASSIRNIYFNEKSLNIQNEFFWMPVREIEELAGGKYGTEDINTAVEDDIEEFGKERFVYKKLQEVTLLPDAKAVLDKATELVKSSFKYRKEFNQSHPEYHINTWDAGWYQIKGMLKEYDPQGLKEFNELYKALEDRMRPLVYELGFLYK